MRSARIGLVLLTAVGVSMPGIDAASQQPQPRVVAPSGPAFEVATIRLNESGSRGRSLAYPSNRFVATNMPLRYLIGNAYGGTLPVRQDMVPGGPGWLDSDGYDVEGVARTSPVAGETAVDVMTRKLMLRNLLAERFALRLHSESRERPHYALVVAMANGTTGPRLKPSTGQECASTPPPADSASLLPLCGPGGPRPLGETGGSFVTMGGSRENHRTFVDRPVVDKTGRSGRFTFELQFTPPPPARPAPDAPDPPADPDSASIFTAVQEQLGLKLDAQRGPIDVLVIDAAERPTPN